MKKHFQFLAAVSVIMLVAAGCAKQPLSQQTVGSGDRQNGQVQPSASSSPQSQALNPAPTGQAQTRQNAGGPDYTPGYVVVTNTVDGSNVNHQYDKIKDGTTAFNLLSSTHKIVTKSYSGIGEMVLSIDGIASDSKHFWEFFVNGKSSNIGASSYKLQDGDTVEWKLSEISN